MRRLCWLGWLQSICSQHLDRQAGNARAVCSHIITEHTFMSWVACLHVGCAIHHYHAGHLLTCAGSGLSSSAAIVCASALAVLGYYGVLCRQVGERAHMCMQPPVSPPFLPCCRLRPLQLLCPGVCCCSGLPCSLPDMAPPER